MNADLRGLVQELCAIPEVVVNPDYDALRRRADVALSVAQGQGWRPIESAPRDGTFYLATDGRECIVRNEPPGCLAGVWHKAKFGGWCGASHTGRLAITHWQPLPAAPPSLTGWTVIKRLLAWWNKPPAPSWSRWATTFDYCPRCSWGFTEKRWREDGGAIETECQNCGLFKHHPTQEADK